MPVGLECTRRVPLCGRCAKSPPRSVRSQMKALVHVPSRRALGTAAAGCSHLGTPSCLPVLRVTSLHSSWSARSCGGCSARQAALCRPQGICVPRAGAPACRCPALPKPDHRGRGWELWRKWIVTSAGPLGAHTNTPAAPCGGRLLTSSQKPVQERRAAPPGAGEQVQQSMCPPRPPSHHRLNSR